MVMSNLTVAFDLLIHCSSTTNHIRLSEALDGYFPNGSGPSKLVEDDMRNDLEAMEAVGISDIDKTKVLSSHP